MMSRAPGFTSVLFAVLGIVVVSVISASAASVPSKQELQSDIPDVEKFLYDLNRYLYRQQQQQRQRHVHELQEQHGENGDDSNELSHLVQHNGEFGNTHQRRLSWPFWSTAAARAAVEAPSEGALASDAVDVNRPYEKRNSELINSLLGLPRVMKVVG